ncbi:MULTISPECIES: heme ABC transporter permease CcmC [unclassified Janthinobacterium]|uniref:heme ABC transporter permease CcmC n=1 Tax=unclassified Janthinobacterium TaxID=2610881 RepID=UPI00088CB06C|nr:MULTISPECIES: heme ABC transporter permease CcmC [unclassified Janthinobacterium]SDA53917.1 heme exporter protein C [Janthinobacterium sp. 551a]SFB45263.1 heme exporter protein C [Janthinobacterium sp. 344]
MNKRRQFTTSIQRRLLKYAAPKAFYPIAVYVGNYALCGAVIMCIVGLVIGFVIAPTDHQQHETYRIIFLHVPTAWMSMFIFLIMAFWSGISLVFKTRLSAMLVRALAPTGAMFTSLALLTGAIWGRPTWGTWWVWDARLTSELILLFLYIGYIGLHEAIQDKRRADLIASLYCLIGAANIPIIYFSVKWWNTLHQGASIKLNGEVRLESIMLLGILVMSVAAWLYSAGTSLRRLACIVRDRESEFLWFRKYSD